MTRSRQSRWRHLVTSVLLMMSCLQAVPAYAAGQLSDRTLFVESPLPSAKTAYTILFTTATTANIGSMRFQFCTTRFGTCDVPVGMDTMAPDLGLIAQFGMDSFVFSQPAQGEILLVRSARPEVAGTYSFYRFSGITNPSFSNVSFFVRISTYSSNDGTGPVVDDGGAVATTNSAISVMGITPETLSFCIGVTGNSCNDLAGQLLGFGDFSTKSTSKASTVMFAATNAAGGYTINIFGTTLASGGNEIPAMGTPTANSSGSDPSVIGKSQFGTNLVGNTTPAIGSNVSGGGIATPTSGYGNPNHFRFFSGDIVASANDSTNINKFTNSYIVNIAPNQAIGYYAATLTYVCTGNF